MRFTVLLALSFPLSALAQVTQPVQPHTQDVPVPPAVTLPGPPKPELAVTNKPLTADEAVRIALRLNPSLAAAKAGVTAAQGRVQQVRSGLLPNASLSSSYSNLNSIRGPAPTGGSSGLSGYSSSVTVRQLLLDFNHTRDTLRQASAQERAQEHELVATRTDVVLLVKQAFYSFVQNTRLVDVNGANVKSTQAQLALAQARFDAEIGAPADVVLAKTNVASAETSLIQAQANALLAQVSLAQTLGVDPRTPIVAADSHEPTPPSDDVTALVDQALKQRPEMLSALESVRAASFGVSAAKTSEAPAMSVSVGASARGTSDPFSTQYSTVGVALGWTFGDGGLTAGLVKQARANLDLAQAALRQTSLTVIEDVSIAYVQLRSAEQRIAVAAAQVANAQESVRLAEGRYSAEVTTFIEVTIAQAALIAAQTNQVNAVSAGDLARASLVKAVGSLAPN
jgi:outer membrane protein TolC